MFNPSAGLGSGAYWQPTCGLIQAGQWYHVVGEYTTLSQPSGCQNAGQYPGAVNIWLNGVPWNQSRHGQTGCFSQYNVVPAANNSPLNVGTMAMDAWFQGAIGKVAIYDKLLVAGADHQSLHAHDRQGAHRLLRRRLQLLIGRPPRSRRA